MMGSDPSDDDHRNNHHPFSPSSPPSHPLLLSDASSSHPLASPPSPPLTSSSFSLFDPEDDGITNDSTPPIPSPSPSPTVRSTALFPSITVGSPQKEHDPSSPSTSTFVSYLISSTSPEGHSWCVRRRFRDLVSLSDRLAESHRGFFVPPRPDKAIVEGHVMHRHEFVEQRRTAVERYLRRLAYHPVIGRSDDLVAFLTAQGRSPIPASSDVASRVIDGAARLPGQLMGSDGHVAPPPQEVVQAARGGRDLLRIFRELKQSVANEWGGAEPQVVEEDKMFLERKGKVKDLEQQLTTASQQAEAFVKSQQDTGEAMGQMGLSLIKLTKFETEETVYNTQKVRAVDIRLAATAAVKASRLYRELNSHTVKHLDTLHEYLGLMLSVHSAFQERSSALLTVQTLLTDLSTLHTKAEKLEAATSRVFGADKSRNFKFEELKRTIKATEDSKCIALKEYERIKENNRSELERLDIERRHDFLNMLKGFAACQVDYAEKMAGVWDKVMEETGKYAKERL